MNKPMAMAMDNVATAMAMNKPMEIHLSDWAKEEKARESAGKKAKERGEREEKKAKGGEEKKAKGKGGDSGSKEDMKNRSLLRAFRSMRKTAAKKNRAPKGKKKAGNKKNKKANK